MDTHHTINLTSRQWFFASLIGVVIILLASGYFQFFVGYKPCSLCEIQRIVFIAIAIILAISVLRPLKQLAIRIYSVIIFLLSVAGIGAATRQVWLQGLPKGEAPACGPSFNFIVKNLAPSDALHQIFYGSGDCAKVDWQFLSLSFAGWAIVFFSFLMIIAIWQFAAPRTRLK